MTIKKLYHGSIHLFEQIDVLSGKGFKDFGRGFYTTTRKDHALSLARRNKKFEEKRLKSIGRYLPVPVYLYSFEFDLNLLNNLSFKRFVSPDKEWVEFIVKNRGNSDKSHPYDIVIGPTADDNTSMTLAAYLRGIYGVPTSDVAIETLIKFLEPQNLPYQWYFGSKISVKGLINMERERLG